MCNQARNPLVTRSLEWGEMGRSCFNFLHCPGRDVYKHIHIGIMTSSARCDESIDRSLQDAVNENIITSLEGPFVDIPPPPINPLPLKHNMASFAAPRCSALLIPPAQHKHTYHTRTQNVNTSNKSCCCCSPLDMPCSPASTCATETHIHVPQSMKADGGQHMFPRTYNTGWYMTGVPRPSATQLSV